MWRDVFKPHYKAIFEFIKGRYPGVYVFIHSCGSIYPIIGDLIDIGLDILNPVQTNAANMEPERLKSEFGRDLTFWGGGADTQGDLPFGTPNDVPGTAQRRSARWRRAAASYSPKALTSPPKCHPRTSSPCSRRSES